MKNIVCSVILAAAGTGTCAASEGALSQLNLAAPASSAWTQPVAAAPTAQRETVNKDISAAQLKNLLKDPNPEIRKAAVTGSRNYILNTYANEPVLEIFLNRKERADIRVEAARVLSRASGYPRVQDAFTGLLRDAGEPRELRVMTYKALYSAAAGSPRVREFLEDAVSAAEKDREARRAAVWALFSCSQYVRTQELLLGVVAGEEEEITRIEAIKSLYGGVGYSRVKNSLLALVKDHGERKPVRLAALKALSGAADSSVERFIQDLVRYEQDTQMRAAAIAAAAPDMAELREYFHLGYRLQSGAYVSPIDKE